MSTPKAMLSKNFSLDEASCPCCGKVVIVEQQVQAMQELREIVKVPIIITSWFRCEKKNKEAGGVPGSYHTRGMATDFHVKYMLVRQMYAAALKIEEFRNGGLGLYPSNAFIHADCRGYHARWAKVKDKDGKLKQVSIDKIYPEES